MPPEEENTGGVKLPPSSSGTDKLYVFRPRVFETGLVAAGQEERLLSAKALNTLTSKYGIRAVNLNL